MSPSVHAGRRAAVTVLLAVAALAAGPAATAATAATAAAAPDPSGPCTDPAGITVVVDLTDLGGGVEVGCAPTAATGAEALTAAGFADTRDASGLVCAIEAAPDPCPTEFTGTYWSYWTADPAGDWTMYMEGPDTAVPAPGSIEGWRYGDGSAGPGVAPAELVTAGVDGAVDGAVDEPVDAPTGDVTADGTTEVSSASDGVGAERSATTDQDSDGAPAWLVVVVGLGVVGAGAAALVGLARRRQDISGPPGQD